MPIWDINEVTSIDTTDSLAFWAPGYFKAKQLRDTLEFYADYGNREISILKLLANGDTHVYGEFVLHDGAIRGFNTVGLSCTDGSSDIVSFRTGHNEGDEVARITKDGVVRAWTGFRGDGPGMTVSSQDRDDGYSAMTLEASDFTFKALDGASLTQWGSMNFTSGQRTLKIWDGTDFHELTTSAEEHIIEACVSGTTTSVERWGTLKIDSSSRRILLVDDGQAPGITLETLAIAAKSIQLWVNDSAVASALRWGQFRADPTTEMRSMQIYDGTDYRNLSTSAAKHIFNACDSATTAVSQWGSLEFVSGERTLKIHNGTSYVALTTAAYKHMIEAWDGDSSALDTWGELNFTSGDRVLKVWDGTNYEPLTISAEELVLRTWHSVTSSQQKWGTFKIVGSDRVINTYDGTNYRDLVIESDDEVRMSMFGAVSSQNDTPGTRFVHYVEVTKADGEDDFDIDVEYKIKVIDVVVQKTDGTGGSGDWVRVYRTGGIERIISVQPQELGSAHRGSG